MDIKPIETSYKGYRFRSRLEARWAVFLDALDIKWEYEKEGFELPSGRYLPDFWLPDWECWVEVKPEDGITERAKNLATELCDATNFPVIITDGLAKNDFQGKFIYKGFKDCYLLNNRFNNIINTYLELVKLARYLDSVEEISPDSDTEVLVAYIRAGFINFARFVGLPSVCDTKFSFQLFDYGEETKPALLLENSHAVVYKQITDRDFDIAMCAGAMYDQLIRCNFFYPIIHCDVANEYIELMDDLSYKHSIIGKALTQAKSARFEHGECG